MFTAFFLPLFNNSGIVLYLQLFFTIFLLFCNFYDYFRFYRWLHGSCDGLVNEEELDLAADHGYHCLYCRPKTKQTLVGVSGMSCRTPSASHPFFSFLSSAGTSTLHG